MSEDSPSNTITAGELQNILQRMGFNLGKTDERSHHLDIEVVELKGRMSSFDIRLAVIETQVDETRRMLSELHDDVIEQKAVGEEIRRLIIRVTETSDSMMLSLNTHVLSETEEFKDQAKLISKLSLDHTEGLDLLSHRLIRVFIALSALVILFMTFLRSEDVLSLFKLVIGLT